MKALTCVRNDFALWPRPVHRWWIENEKKPLAGHDNHQRPHARAPVCLRPEQPQRDQDEASRKRPSVRPSSRSSRAPTSSSRRAGLNSAR